MMRVEAGLGIWLLVSVALVALGGGLLLWGLWPELSSARRLAVRAVGRLVK